MDAPADVGSGADIEQRRNAARLLWKSLSSTPEEAAADTLRAEMAATEAKQLRSQINTAQQTATEAQAQLAEERDNWFLNPMVLALGGGLLLSLGALAALIARQRRGRGAVGTEGDSRNFGDNPEKPGKAPKPPKPPKAAKQPWWKKRTDPQAETDGEGLGKTVPAIRSRVEPGSKVIDIDVDTLFPEDSEFASLGPADAGGKRSQAGGAHADFMDAGRSVATEELFDLQQQVEFFISLGQADQAVEVLVNHLSDSQEPSPLAYLDLLKLYHELDQRGNYEDLRKVFNGKFNGGAPDFEHYSNSRRGLERYESALSRIQSLWNTPAVLDVIERSIFRHEGPDESTEMFDLEAYRELLLLYGIAREVQSTNEVGEPSNALAAERKRRLANQATPDFGPTTIQPLAAGTLETRLREDRKLDQAVEHSVREAEDQTQAVDMGSVGVDLDLDLDLTSGMGDLAPLDAPQAAHSHAPVAPPSALPKPTGSAALDFHLDDFSADLSLPSVNQAASAPAGTQRQTTPELPGASSNLDTVPPANQFGDSMGLDLLDLDALDGMKIKKSGKGGA